MANLEVVTGPPFSGKGQYVRDEVARREREGELGLVVVDWTALYGALVPGAESALRDEAVSDTGAPRFVGGLFLTAAARMAARELRGYVTTQSPHQALELVDGDVTATLTEVDADVADVAERAGYHVNRLGRRVTRAVSVADCRRAAVAYFREAPALVGRAREVRRSGRGWKRGEVKRPFDRALWLKGLTAAGRDAVAELQSLGNPEPSPADVMAFLLRNR